MRKVLELTSTRSIQTVLMVPTEHAWTFMKKFGEVFVDRERDGEGHARPVDKYHDDGSVFWTITVTVKGVEEGMFHRFIHAFVDQYGLILQDDTRDVRNVLADDPQVATPGGGLEGMVI